jgi:alpha-ketoglutarate-dependent taurine dioxygenase
LLDRRGIVLFRGNTWQMNELLIWDNTGTMRLVPPFDVQCGRRLHRYTLLGEEPVAAA